LLSIFIVIISLLDNFLLTILQIKLFACIICNDENVPINRFSNYRWQQSYQLCRFGVDRYLLIARQFFNPSFHRISEFIKYAMYSPNNSQNSRVMQSWAHIFRRKMFLSIYFSKGKGVQFSTKKFARMVVQASFRAVPLAVNRKTKHFTKIYQKVNLFGVQTKK